MMSLYHCNIQRSYQYMKQRHFYDAVSQLELEFHSNLSCNRHRSRSWTRRQHARHDRRRSCQPQPRVDRHLRHPAQARSCHPVPKIHRPAHGPRRRSPSAPAAINSVSGSQANNYSGKSWCSSLPPPGGGVGHEHLRLTVGDLAQPTTPIECSPLLGHGGGVHRQDPGARAPLRPRRSRDSSPSA